MSLAILFHFLCTQHVSDINISIIRSLWLCCWITTSVVLFSVRCVLEIWCGWVWVVLVLQASACNTNTTATGDWILSSSPGQHAIPVIVADGQVILIPYGPVWEVWTDFRSYTTLPRPGSPSTSEGRGISLGESQAPIFNWWSSKFLPANISDTKVMLPACLYHYWVYRVTQQNITTGCYQFCSMML